jgi:predicted nuclease with TOPRIM domain
MQSDFRLGRRISVLAIFLLLNSLSSLAGVSHLLQSKYKKTYENKALFLKIPVYSDKQMIYITGQSFRADQGAGAPRYKVGDQLRVLLVDFAGDEVKFRMGGIGTQSIIEIVFKFDSSLQENFPNSDVFDRALLSTFTEGLKYADIEDAKSSFVEDQFERSVREIAGSASISRESVLKSIAPHIPAYQDAQRDLENLRNRVQDLSAQLSQSQAENRKLESESRAQQGEITRLKNANASLQEKIDNSAAQVSKLGDELRDVKGTAQGYQKELASLQRSLNIKVDASRDLASQITDLGQAMRKLQRENEGLANQINTLKTNLDAQQAANARLLGDNEELKASNRQMQSTIKTLTSNENSLARQYLNLKNAKEKLDDYANAVKALRTRVVEEKTDGRTRQGKANLYLGNVLLGSLEWSIASDLNHNESGVGEAKFTAESIDYVKVTPEERHLLHSFGERLKIRVDLASGSNLLTLEPDAGNEAHNIGERDSSTWHWKIHNQGTQEAHIFLTAHLINRNSDEISFLQQEQSIRTSNLVRRVRDYLQPISLVLGVILGFLLFGIVRVFRRGKKIKPVAPGSESVPYTGKKQL